jgi:hypothetical protein
MVFGWWPLLSWWKYAPAHCSRFTVSAPAPLSPPLRALGLVVIALSLLLLGGYLYYLCSGHPHYDDFFVFWAAAGMARQAPLAAVYDPAQFQAYKLAHVVGDLASGHLAQFPFVYPPSAMLLFAPFARLPFGVALACWNLLSLALFLAAVRRSLKTPWAMAAALVAPATVIDLLLGQTGLLTGALALLGFGLLRQRPLAAGVLLGLLTFKPQLALLPLPVLLLAGQYRAGMAAVATAAVLVGASLAAFGLEPWQAWLAALHDFSGGLSASLPHQQYGVTAYFALLALGLDGHLALGLQAAVSLVMLWLVARTLRQGGEPARTALPLLGLYLATPYAAAYDLPALAAVCLLLFGAGLRQGFRDGEPAALAAAWCLPPLLLFSPLPLGVAAVAVLLALFVLVLRRDGAAAVA